MVLDRPQCVRYAITNLSETTIVDVKDDAIDDRASRRKRWLADVDRWTAAGVDFIQLREKTVDAGELFHLAREGMQFRGASEVQGRPKLLINGRPDVAAASGADGVHLTARSGELVPFQVRQIFQAAGMRACTVSISCHTLEEVKAAHEGGADLILFGPVFEKSVAGRHLTTGTGLELLHQACVTAGSTPVVALGGITSETVAQVLATGAAGAAGIRLFSRE